MNIELSKEEYLTLLQLVNYGKLVVLTNEEEFEKVADLEQKLYQVAQEQDAAEFVQPDEDGEDLELSDAYVDEVEDNVEAYEEEIFWENLVLKMVSRDIQESDIVLDEENIDVDEYLAKTQPIAEKYQNEFAERGVANLRLVEAPAAIMN